MKGYFIVAPTKDKPLDIKFQIPPDKKEQIPASMKELYTQAESTISIIRALMVNQVEKKDQYMRDLLKICQVGLVGEHPQTDLAKQSLEKLREEILLNEGSTIKNHYFRRMGLLALMLLAIFITPAVLLSGHKDLLVSAYLFVASGAVVGSWVSFAVRKLNLKFEELAVMEEDGLGILIKLIFIAVISVILLLFLRVSLVDFSVGNIQLNTMMDPTNVEVQLAIGVIAGMLGNKLAANLYSTAEKTLKYGQ